MEETASGLRMPMKSAGKSKKNQKSGASLGRNRSRLTHASEKAPENRKKIENPALRLEETAPV